MERLQELLLQRERLQAAIETAGDRFDELSLQVADEAEALAALQRNLKDLDVEIAVLRGIPKGAG